MKGEVLKHKGREEKALKGESGLNSKIFVKWMWSLICFVFGDMWSQKLIWSYVCLGIVMLCFIIYVLIICSFKGNLLSNSWINCYGCIMWS